MLLDLVGIEPRTALIEESVKGKGSGGMANRRPSYLSSSSVSLNDANKEEHQSNCGTEQGGGSQLNQLFCPLNNQRLFLERRAGVPCNDPPPLSRVHPDICDQKLRTPAAAFEFSVPMKTALQYRTATVYLTGFGVAIFSRNHIIGRVDVAREEIALTLFEGWCHHDFDELVREAIVKCIFCESQFSSSTADDALRCYSNHVCVNGKGDQTT